MRQRLIKEVPGLKPDGRPWDRFAQFARMVIAVPKSEVEKQTKKSGSAKNRAGFKKRVPNGTTQEVKAKAK